MITYENALASPAWKHYWSASHDFTDRGGDRRRRLNSANNDQALSWSRADSRRARKPTLEIVVPWACLLAVHRRMLEWCCCSHVRLARHSLPYVVVVTTRYGAALQHRVAHIIQPALAGWRVSRAANRDLAHSALSGNRRRFRGCFNRR